MRFSYHRAAGERQQNARHVRVTWAGTLAIVCVSRIALFRDAAKIDVVHNVPYKGAPESVTSVVRGDSHFYFNPANVSMELMESGKVRAIAGRHRQANSGDAECAHSGRGRAEGLLL